MRFKYPVLAYLESDAFDASAVPWFSEYSEDGKLLHEVQFGQIDGRAEHDHSYRVYKVRLISLVPSE